MSEMNRSSLLLFSQRWLTHLIIYFRGYCMPTDLTCWHIERPQTCTIHLRTTATVKCSLPCSQFTVVLAKKLCSTSKLLSLPIGGSCQIHKNSISSNTDSILVFVDKVWIWAEWPIRPELLPVSVAWSATSVLTPPRWHVRPLHGYPH